jgi:hypothetical protein
VPSIRNFAISVLGFYDSRGRFHKGRPWGLLPRSNSNSFDTIILTSKLSNHFSIVFHKENTARDNSNEFFEAHNFSEHNIKVFKDILMLTDWNCVLSAN